MMNENFDTIIYEIIAALKEKGYDPYEQLEGYAQFRNDTYITRHNGAREKIKNLDIDQIRKYLDEQGL